jgi:hypothetical protein
VIQKIVMLRAKATNKRVFIGTALALGVCAATFFGPALLKGANNKTGHNVFDVDK